MSYTKIVSDCDGSREFAALSSSVNPFATLFSSVSAAAANRRSGCDRAQRFELAHRILVRRGRDDQHGDGLLKHLVSLTSRVRHVRSRPPVYPRRFFRVERPPIRLGVVLEVLEIPGDLVQLVIIIFRLLKEI